MVELMGRFDAAFSSEPTYAEAFRRFYPWAEAVLLDEQRIEQSVSGTELRTLPLSRVYGRLPRSYQVLVNRSVLVTGTASRRFARAPALPALRVRPALQRVVQGARIERARACERRPFSCCRDVA